MSSEEIKLCPQDECTGCQACMNICPHGCIEMVTNSEGFLNPQIDTHKCIRCSRCRSVCPVLTKAPKCFVRTESPEIYACWIKDDKVRQKSSSGGLFSAIALNVFNQGGIVFGAAFDNQMHLSHIGIDEINLLDKLRRSKYIQSEIGNCFKLVEEKLKTGKPVFFVGAPCQIAGLNLFLGTDYENLITADFICHGVSSPVVFSKYVEYIESIYSLHVKDVNFRDKRKGWGEFFFFYCDF